MFISKLSQKQEEMVVSDYLHNHITCFELGKKFEVSSNTISRILQRYQIPIINRTKPRPCKYIFNHDYFNVIDTEDKAYFLGLLYADGCLYAKENRLQISLIDQDILEKFTMYLKSNRPLRYIPAKTKNHKAAYLLIMQHKQIFHDLNKLGCVPNKTFLLKFPTKEQVPKDLLRHFIRGYFDGDGSIGGKPIEAKEKFTRKVSFVSTEDFCFGLNQFIESCLGIKGHISKRHKNRDTNTRQYEFGGKNQVLRFLNWLYQDATVYLDRKYKIYLSFTQHITSKPVYNKEKLSSMYKCKKCRRIVNQTTLICKRCS